METLFGQGSAPEEVPVDRVVYQIFGTLRQQPTAAADAASGAAAATAAADDASTAEALEACKMACLAHLEPFLEGYIWQKEPFQLEVVGEDAARGGVPAHLAGSSCFGDNIEDEWFIVWMLRELTRAFPTLTARVWDNDGEFLLIECAFHLPKWVKPDAVANRVFLHGGDLHVVPPTATDNLGPWAKPSDKLKGRRGKGKEKGKSQVEDADADADEDEAGAATVTLDAALWLVRGGDGTQGAGGDDAGGDDAGGAGGAGGTGGGTGGGGRGLATLAPVAARDAVARRLEGYPGAAREGMHRAYAVLPARLAHVLAVEPQLIAPAVEAFYERDPEGLKAAAKMTRFPPEEMSGALVNCTRCLYGQLVRQRFAPPRRYPMPSPTDQKAFAAAELGMKIVVGFEMLAAEWARNGHDILPNDPKETTTATATATATTTATAATTAAAREEEEEEKKRREKREEEKEPVGDATWDAFKSSLGRNGYFRGEMTGSAAHRRLLAAAVTQYNTSAWSERARAVAAAPARRAAAALASVLRACLGSKDLPAVDHSDADGDTWMYEDPAADPLERELNKRELERRAMLERAEGSGSGSGAGAGAGAGAGTAAGAGAGGDGGGAAAGAGDAGTETAGVEGQDGIDGDVLAAMAERLKSFMGEKSGHEGVDIKEQRRRRGGDEDDDDGDEDEGGDEEDDEGLLDAHKFLAELSTALGMDQKNQSGGGGGGGGGRGGMMDGVFTDDDDDDFSSDDSSDSDDSDSNDSDDDDENRGNYVYEDDRGGNWGGVNAAAATAAAAAASAASSAAAGAGSAEDTGWSDGVRVSPAGAQPARVLDSDDETDSDGDGDGFMDEYEKAMRRQLRGTDVAATFTKVGVEAAKARGEDHPSASGVGGGVGGGGGGESRVLPRGFGDDDDEEDSDGSSGDDEDEDEAEGDEALDLDMNLVENMLASYKGQEGMSGPASNLLASMGVKGVSFNNFGEDEDEEEDDDEDEP